MKEVFPKAKQRFNRNILLYETKKNKSTQMICNISNFISEMTRELKQQKGGSQKTTD